MKRWSLSGVIFCLTFATLVIEVLLTRVLSVVYFGHTAFLIISLALFGYGISGVFLSLAKLSDPEKGMRALSLFLFLFSLSIPLIYRLVLLLRIDFLHLFSPISNFFYLMLTFLLLLLPFFFSGVVLALTFSHFSTEIGKLYFVDLIGAALGSLAVIPLIPWLGPSRTLLIIFLLLALCWFLVSRASRLKRTAWLLFACLAFGIMFRYEDRLFPIIPKDDKRFFAVQKKNKRIEFSRWSTINKIDVAPWPFPPARKVIWINGGTMQSFIHRFDGNVNALKPINWNIAAIPYQMAQNGSALIIGSAGGFEVICALSHRFQNVVAVELDPVICSMLKKEYSEYSGRLFGLPRVTLLADEGRSVVQRLKTKFDVIQMVNSHNTDNLLAGAMSLSETYIYTVEAFQDYWNRLNENGFLYIVHWNGERLFSTALQALKEMGIPHPEKRFFIIQKGIRPPKRGFNTFVMKKGDFTEADYQILKAVADPEEIVYSPDFHRENFYTDILDRLPQAVEESSVDIAPVRDNSPYLTQTNKIGQFHLKNIKLAGTLSRELIANNLIFSNSIYLSILGLSILFSLVLIYLPLKRLSAKNERSPLVFYFFLIGIAFISVEIIAIKIFQLFLGSPAVSISIIIFSLLVSSGIGSLMSVRLDRWFHGRSIIVFSLCLTLILLLYSFFLFQILHTFLHWKFAGRLVMTILLLFIPGFMMGSFFPFGIRILGEKNPRSIGWAWGANAFATVLGSILTIIVSINWNFSLALSIAAACYLAAGVLVHRWKKNQLI